MALKRNRPSANIDQEISQRILIFSVVILLSFLAVFLRLIFIQVISHDDYTAKKDDYTSIKQYISAPRGQIYDRNGKVLAATVVSHNIVYTSPQNMSQDDYELYAGRIVEVFDIKKSEISNTEKKEAYIAYKSFLKRDDPEYGANHLLTDKEMEEYRSGVWGANAESRRYALLLGRISEEEIDEMSDEELKSAVVYNRMIKNAASGQENVVIEDVSDEDVSYLVEHKTEFPGFDVDFGGWKREYPYDETLSDVLGKVSTNTEGLPSENAEYYLQKGYQYNSTVGKSGLEFQYNDILAGTAQESIITYDSKGLAHKNITRQAMKGNDIYLTIDVDMQQQLDQIVKQTLETYAGTQNRENFSTLFMCMEDPNDGGILAMSGYQIDLDTKKTVYFASGCYQSLANPGSSVKGATVYMGESEKVVKPDEVIMDEVMNIAGQEFASYENQGPVNDIKALSVSSNVYMFNIAIRLGGATYEPGGPLGISDVQGTVNKMRSYYSMFGLGNKTGLDVPDESSGYMGAVNEPGMLLNYAIGQLDMYTPVQLLQYVSTIANDGNLYKPSLLRYVKEVNSDQVIEVGTGRKRSVLPSKNKEYLERVQLGFRACVESGNASEALQQMGHSIAGKTGTAEVTEWTTAVFVGYAPFDKPEVSFACVAPTSSINEQNLAPNICSNEVVPLALNRYFSLYPSKE
ncbi:MAG: penicillin-binding protein 2 [Erysipelotrichaceae bacterium]|nr:penicillin-binding protein 2 [Erysipelotrichaceae bacterium]